MTGYNVDAVQFDLDNAEGSYLTYTGIIQRTAWWDDDDATWNDVGKAAQAVAAYVAELWDITRGTDDARGVFGEIHDADLDSVDWERIVSSILAQENIEAGRDADAGLS